MNPIKKVLIIDDSPIDSFLSEKALMKFHSAIVTKTINVAKDALAYLNSLNGLSSKNSVTFIPDTVFLDIHMPQMNGFQLLNELKNSGFIIKNSIRIYILSSSNLGSEIQSAINKNLCHGYITKPLNQDKLNHHFGYS